jgi:hypothetical protein
VRSAPRGVSNQVQRVGAGNIQPGVENLVLRGTTAVFSYP